MVTKHVDSHQSEDKDHVKHSHERIMISYTKEEMETSYLDLFESTFFVGFRSVILVGSFFSIPVLLQKILNIMF